MITVGNRPRLGRAQDLTLNLYFVHSRISSPQWLMKFICMASTVPIFSIPAKAKAPLCGKASASLSPALCRAPFSSGSMTNLGVGHRRRESFLEAR